MKIMKYSVFNTVYSFVTRFCLSQWTKYSRSYHVSSDYQSRRPVFNPRPGNVEFVSGEMQVD